MTIAYPDGTVLQAMLLSRGNDTLRAAVQGEDDARSFTLIGGAWISEDREPVQIEFAWQRSEPSKTPTEADCICPKELASRLMATLLIGSPGDELLDDMLLAWSAGSRPVESNRVN